MTLRLVRGCWPSGFHMVRDGPQMRKEMVREFKLHVWKEKIKWMMAPPSLIDSAFRQLRPYTPAEFADRQALAERQQAEQVMQATGGRLN